MRPGYSGEMFEDTVETLLTGEWSRDQVEASYDPAQARTTDPQIEALVERSWHEAERQAAIHGRSLFAGPLFRLVSYELSGDRIRMLLGPTDYREFLGTNGNRRQIEQQVGPLDLPHYLSNPLAVGAAVRSSDGKLVVGRRSQRTMQDQGCWHVPAGHVDPRFHLHEGRVDAFQAISDEIHEELGCPREGLEPVLLGLVRATETLKPEMLFAVNLPISWAELSALPLNEEHEAIQAIDDTPRAIDDFLRQSEPAVVPAGAACLWRYGVWKYGPDWLRDGLLN